MFLTTFKYAFVSNGHITESDETALRIKKRSSWKHLQVDNIDGGHLVCCHDYHLSQNFDIKKCIEEDGISQELANILVIAGAQGCTHVRFDTDGDVYSELPQFDW